MTLSSSGYRRKEQPVRIRRGPQWQVDNKTGWHRSPSPGVLSTAFSWEFPCASFVGNLPSKNGSRPFGGLIKILLLCPNMYCRRQTVGPGQWVLRCRKERGTHNRQSSEVAAADTAREYCAAGRHRERGRGPGHQCAVPPGMAGRCVHTEAIWHTMSISRSDWHPLYLQMNFTHELKRPRYTAQQLH